MKLELVAEDAYPVRRTAANDAARRTVANDSANRSAGEAGTGVLQGVGFSPYVYDVESSRKSAPEPCEVSFYGREDLEGRLIAFSPEQGIVTVQPAGASANENLRLEDVRALRFTEPVDLKRSVEHFRRHGITVQTIARRAPFSLSFRDGREMTGELLGYGAARGGIGVYLAGEGEDAGGRGIRCFFPADSVENFAVGEKLGKLLLAREELTETGLRAALATQQTLRAQKLGEILVENRIVDQAQLEQAIRRQGSRPMRRLGEVLVESGIIDEHQLEDALALQRQRRTKPLGEILLEMGLLDAATIRSVLAQKLGIPHVDLAKFRVEPAAVEAVPGALCAKHHLMPLYRTGNQLVVAMEDPLDAKAIEALRFTTQLKIVPVLATREEIDAALRKRPSDGAVVWNHEAEKAAGLAPEGLTLADPGSEELASRLELEAAPGEAAIEREDSVRETDNTLVRLVNKIVLDAHEQGASDIHIETRPGRENTRVRFRRDGILQDYLEVPARFRGALVARIKVMANLDISDKRRPQDGKIDFKRYGPASLELRVATIPTNNGLESVVLRILAGATPMPMDRLQLAPRVLPKLRELAGKPYGLLLVCGPTGSGKTTTLHSVLGYINTPERKIWTAEDPVEITQPGLSQVQVNAKIGWTFAAALRAFLRADPDVVMIGEMRDAETAQAGVEASLTGHLVLSTLHTNSAVESVTRLLDMELDPYNFADALLGVLAQRLARRLCPSCKAGGGLSVDNSLAALAQEYCANTPLDPAETLGAWLTADRSPALCQPVGCAECGGTGYRGRVALHELLSVTPELRQAIRARAPVSEMLPQAIRDGMRTLKQDGIEKVLQGLTTIEQVRAVCT